MKHIVTLSIVIFSLAQLSNAHPCASEQLRYGYKRGDSLANALITVTISLDNPEHQVPLLDGEVQMPVSLLHTEVEKPAGVNYSFAGISAKHNVKNNSP